VSKLVFREVDQCGPDDPLAGAQPIDGEAPVGIRFADRLVGQPADHRPLGAVLASMEYSTGLLLAPTPRERKKRVDFAIMVVSFVRRRCRPRLGIK
jgi:hypothetical protein